jgi:hypothetical protein
MDLIFGNRKKSQGASWSKWWGLASTALKTALQTKRYELTHFPDAKSTNFFTILAISFWLIPALQSRFQCNSVDWQSGHWVPTLDIKNSKQHGIELGMTRVTFFLPLSWRVWCPLIQWLSLCCKVICKYLSLITCNYWFQQIQFVLITLQKVRTVPFKVVFAQLIC